jgi:hypothetical protein
MVEQVKLLMEITILEVVEEVLLVKMGLVKMVLLLVLVLMVMVEMEIIVLVV